MTFNPYAGLPAWLTEGLAMYAEGTLEVEYRALLKRATAEKSLISVRSLSSPFSARAETSYLSYAQSYSLVDFLVTNYGQGKMLELLNTFGEGSSYDGALEKVYGFDMDGLDALSRGKTAISAQLSGNKMMHPVLIGTVRHMLGRNRYRLKSHLPLEAATGDFLRLETSSLPLFP
jgi:hypothetical protein